MKLYKVKLAILLRSLQVLGNNTIMFCIMLQKVLQIL